MMLKFTSSGISPSVSSRFFRKCPMMMAASIWVFSLFKSTTVSARSLGIEKALEEISQNRGILYDPNVVDACLKLFRKKGFKLE